MLKVYLLKQSDIDLVRYPKLAFASPRGIKVGSEESIAHMMAFKPRATDIFIATSPKSGTTLLQQICHQLRTHGDMDYDDIHQVVPYMPQALDVGLDLNAEQKAAPRLFKVHSPLSSLPAAGKFIVTARDPCDMIQSTYDFYTAKFGKMSQDIETFVRERVRPESFCVFREGYMSRNKSNVLFLAYDCLLDQERKVICIQRVAALMGVVLTQELLDITMHLSSKEIMLEHVSKYDNSWTLGQLAKHRKSSDDSHGKMAKPYPKVITRAKVPLPSKVKEIILEMWYEHVGVHIGMDTYQDMLRAVQEEYPLSGTNAKQQGSSCLGRW